MRYVCQLHLLKEKHFPFACLQNLIKILFVLENSLTTEVWEGQRQVTAAPSRLRQVRGGHPL